MAEGLVTTQTSRLIRARGGGGIKVKTSGLRPRPHSGPPTPPPQNSENLVGSVEMIDVVTRNIVSLPFSL